MTRYFYLITVLTFFSSGLLAQTGILKGTVKDSLTGVVLESATVTVLKKDSSLVNYQLTNGYGGFTINKLPLQTDLLLNITYAGFKSYNSIITIDSSILNINVILSPSFNDSNNVIVTAVIPIRMNGDTLEINPAAFKMDPNAVVEDLLTRVPGITVWADGSITMNGKPIPNVLVDGKPFMGQNDARIATQNLPKEAIDKIQVYSEVDRSLSQEQRKIQDSLLTMNIKLKENKKTGYFGKLGVGYGTRDRFETDLSFQMYNKTTSFGVGGGYNNINKNIGNLKEMFQNNTYRNYNPNLRYVGNFNNDGINKNHSIGGVFTHNFIETTNSRQNNRITVNYTKSGADRFVNIQRINNQTIPGHQQIIESNSVSNSLSNNHNFGIQYIKTNSYDDNFEVNGNGGWSNNRNNANSITDVKDSIGNLISNNRNRNFGNSQSNNQNLSIIFSKRSQDNPLAQYRVDINANRSDNKSDRYENSIFNSFVDDAKDTSYNRRYQNNNSSTEATATLTYEGLKRLLLGRYNFFGIDMNFVQWLNYNNSENNQATFNYDSTTQQYRTDNRLTYLNKNKKLEYSPQIQFRKNFFKWNEKRDRNIGINLTLIEDLKKDENSSSISNRNLTRSFAFLGTKPFYTLITI